MNKNPHQNETEVNFNISQILTWQREREAENEREI